MLLALLCSPKRVADGHIHKHTQTYTGAIHKTISLLFQGKPTIQLTAPTCLRLLALQARQWMSDNITADNSLRFC